MTADKPVSNYQSTASKTTTEKTGTFLQLSILLIPTNSEHLSLLLPFLFPFAAMLGLSLGIRRFNRRILGVTLTRKMRNLKVIFMQIFIRIQQQSRKSYYPFFCWILRGLLFNLWYLVRFSNFQSILGHFQVIFGSFKWPWRILLPDSIRLTSPAELNRDFINFRRICL